MTLPVTGRSSVLFLGNALPAAILQQYPALAGLDWNSLPQGPPPDEEAYSGRISFDTFSGGELHEDLSENELGTYPPLDPNMGGNAIKAAQAKGDEETVQLLDSGPISTQRVKPWQCPPGCFKASG
jgi:hypothetical protein